jgi:hypothetical protein
VGGILIDQRRVKNLDFSIRMPRRSWMQTYQSSRKSRVQAWYRGAGELVLEIRPVEAAKGQPTRNRAEETQPGGGN